jgi:phage major head subunit gpT-like protein
MKNEMARPMKMMRNQFDDDDRGIFQPNKLSSFGMAASTPPDNFAYDIAKMVSN